MSSSLNQFTWWSSPGLTITTAYDCLLFCALFTFFTTLSFLSWSVISYLRSPLRRYPGPPLAGFTNLWRLYHIRQGSFHLLTEALHKKYGPVVRIAPNVLDVDYPELLKLTFGTKGEWRKTGSVLASSSLVNGQIVYNLFSHIDPDIHAREKRPIAKYYSATGVALLEAHIDKTIALLCDQLDKRFISKTESDEWSKEIDLGEWITFYTWDSVGTVTFSQPLGYLSSATDHDGTLSTAEKSIDYFATCYSLPFLDRLMDKNPIAIFRKLGPPGFGPVTGLAVQRMIARVKGEDKEVHDSSVPDFLDKFLEARASHPEVVDDNVLVGYMMNNMIAGADTTAIVLRSVFYFPLKQNRRVWDKLSAEVLANVKSEDLAGQGTVSYKAARTLPYLEAVVKESLRFQAPIALGLERVVPKGGFTLAGDEGGYVPEGAVLAFNPWIIGRNKGVYGEDADVFRPERWLKGDGESQEKYEERLQAMNNAELSFGGGSRSCLGKHMALMQIYKVLATMVLYYDVDLVKPEREWKVINSLFARQEGLKVCMKRRV
ncbi:cytochrome P450 [Cladorrhinum sp. PSN259]|nr:cytochrome P450 [Cladorrhinum sp. PSN259]